ncbi:Site-specific recombinase XerC [Paenibacillus algorifonticola]|uniref:Site-specific recombinase XerC n=1 Tax=Paenibacillus algorifonticola TaxID=684063 RepID=A0A1I1XTZ9_9BACL|nr:site-specific integrase [Paenibacillus algorifonticola]SFE10827.1 Site-specific recombinase XerC [Paenibacillus algorifonticola]
MAKGSIEKRGENTWRLTVDLGLNADGTRNRPRQTVTIEDEALLRTTKRLKDYLDDQLAAFKLDVLSGNYIAPAKLTFKDFYEKEWIPKYAAIELKNGTTLKSHCSKINNHVLPRIGHKRIDEITTMQLVKMFADLRKPGARVDKRGGKDTLSSRTIQYTYDVTNSVFARAVEWNVLKVNPLDGVKRPQISKEDKKARKDRKNYYEDDEATAVIDALLETKSVWRMYFLGAIMGGFRRGELIALEIDDCDFVNCRLRIDESISNTENSQADITDTKNEASNDYVDMPLWYMEELAAHIKANRKLKLKLMDKWEGGDRNFVFHSGLGKPYYHTTPTQRWENWCKKNGFRYVTLHGLRHTNATYLLEQGASIKEIQHRLRHATSQVTSDTYAHVTKKLSRKTASHLDKFDPKVRPQSVPNGKNDAHSS